MSSSLKLLFVAAALCAAGAAAAQTYPGIGRPATAPELKAWDIDVRPDFKGLPAGSGSVAQGMQVWEAKCASCHGVFGEANEVFSPLIGGTTKDDIRTGRVASLANNSFPGRTTLMKVPTVSTLWDYINRAMPWNAPKSLSVEEVYAVTAYLLNMAEVLPDNHVLSDRNMAEVQKLLPNRNGMSTDHGLWPGRPASKGGLGNGGQPDVKAVACMKDCPGEHHVASFLPDFARNQHGNLAEQNRLVGAQVGADTTRPAGVAPAAPVAPRPAPPAAAGGAPTALLNKYTCTACHGMDNKVVGPGFAEIARKYAAKADREAYLVQKVMAGGVGVWGQIPMPPQALSAAEAQAIASWLAQGAKK